MMMRCMQAADFREGVRALLVDKDNNPKWTPSRLEDVSDEAVLSYFDNLNENEFNL